MEKKSFNIENNDKENNNYKRNMIIGIVIIISFILVLVVISMNTGNINKHADKSYIQYCTISAIKYYYPLKYPDTFKLKTIDYEYSSYEEKGYELWKTTGRFTAENKLGLEVNNTFEVWLKFVYEEGKCYYMKVLVDGELLHYTPL